MDNFFRNEASAFLTLPIRLGNEPELLDLLMIREPFWAEFYTRPNAINLVIGLVSMALLSLGIATAFKKQPQAVLVFLGLHLVYSMSSAVVRLSGWRFIKSADWMLFAFFALGIVEIFACFGNHSKNWSESIGYEFWLDQPGTQKKRTYSNFANLSLAALFLLSGGFIPFRELLLPKSIPEYSREKICAIFESALEASEPTENFPSFSEYCMSEENLVYSGYGIYPRYFKAGEGYYDRPNDPYFGEQPYSRLVFRMIGERKAKLLFKTSEPDIFFPNGSVVFTITGKGESNEVNFLMVMGETSEILISDPVLAAVETSHD